MIKNYTSGVPVSRTLSRIEEILVNGGAINIMKDYKNGVIDAVCFLVEEPTSGKKIAVRLPANVEAVYEILQSEVRRPRSGTLEKLKEQANRTAWKLMQDWVEVQMSLIAMHQAEFLQVFLPYVWDGKRTFFHTLKENGFKLLTDGEQGRTK